MDTGVYLAGRSIPYNWPSPLTHQFIVLVPREGSALTGMSRPSKAGRVIVLGAYPDKGFLRAKPFNQRDISPLNAGRAELDKVKLGMCYADSDMPLTIVWNCFLRYRAWEGTPDEIKYPSHSEQLSDDSFNSNSWAQSCIFWALKMQGAHARQDFSGFDPGNDRLIPRKYFR